MRAYLQSVLMHEIESHTSYHFLFHKTAECRATFNHPPNEPARLVVCSFVIHCQAKRAIKYRDLGLNAYRDYSLFFYPLPLNIILRPSKLALHRVVTPSVYFVNTLVLTDTGETDGEKLILLNVNEVRL